MKFNYKSKVYSREALESILIEEGKKASYFVPMRHLPGIYRVYSTGVQTNKQILSLYRSAEKSVLPDYPVQISGDWDYRSEPHGFASISSNILAPVIGKKILIKSCSFQTIEMNTRGAFQIYIGANEHTDCEFKEKSTPETMYGIDTSDFYDCGITNGPTTDDSQLIKTDEGDVVAELHENALYIHFLLARSNGIKAKKVFAQILNKVAQIIESNAIDFESLKESRAERLRQSELKAFEDLFEKYIPAKIKANKEKKRSLEYKVRQKRDELRQSIVALAEYDVAVDKDKIKESLKRDLEMLETKFDTVETFKIRNGGVVFTTKKIKCRPRGSEYKDMEKDLGRLEITLPFGSGYYGITAKSLCYETALPHADGEQYESDALNMCFGTMSEQIQEYMANYEILSAITLMIAFFEKGVDPDDGWGEKIFNFPDWKEEVV